MSRLDFHDVDDERLPPDGCTSCGDWLSAENAECGETVCDACYAQRMTEQAADEAERERAVVWAELPGVELGGDMVPW